MSNLIFHRHKIIDYVIILVVAIIFIWPYFQNKLPVNDFPGSVLELSNFRDSLLQNHDISYWRSSGYLGFSQAETFSHIIYRPIFVGLSFIFSDILSFKLMFTFCFIMAGLCMYCFINYIFKNRDQALLGGLFYILFPIFIQEVGLYGHIVVATLYALLPLILVSIYKIIINGRWRDALWGAIIIALSFIASNEHFILFSPFLFLFSIILLFQKHYTNFSYRVLVKDLIKLITSGIVALSLVFFAVLPIFMEKGLFSLFGDKAVMYREYFSLNNIFYFFGRQEKLYLGLVFLILFLLVLIFRKKIQSQMKLVLTILFLLFMSVWFSFGANSIYNSTKLLLQSTSKSLDGFWLGEIGVVACLIVLIYLAISGLNTARKVSNKILAFKILGILAILILVFVSAENFIAHLPLIKTIRNPSWFIVFSGLFVAILASYAVYLLALIPKTKIQKALFALIIILLIIDVWPMRASFNQQVDITVLEQAQTALAGLNDSTDLFRYYNTRSYAPIDDYLSYKYMPSKDSSYGWITSVSLLEPAMLMSHVTSAFQGFGGIETDVALMKIAGLANIKYFVDHAISINKNVGNIPADLLVAYQDDNYTIYDNPYWKPRVQLYNQKILYIATDNESNGDKTFNNLKAAIRDVSVYQINLADIDSYNQEFLKSFNYVVAVDPNNIPDFLQEKVLKDFNNISGAESIIPENISYAWEKSGQFKINVSNTDVSQLVFAEAKHPYWQATVDDEETDINRVNYAFMGFELQPGEHEIIFTYKIPRSYYIGYAVSVISLIIVIGFLIVSSQAKFQAQALQAHGTQ
ncbi:MAG: YfhO family protein [Patescibacteria group bacterium]